MLGCKVFLTYRRKRLTGNGHGHGHGNGCPSLVSLLKETPLGNSDLYDELVDKIPSEQETINSSHVCRERSLCCSCVDKRDSTASPSTQKSSRFEAEKYVEESSEGTSKRGIVGLPFTDDCLPNKSCYTQMGSSPRVNADILGHNSHNEGREVSCSRDTATATTADYVESHETPEISKKSSEKTSDSLAKDELDVLCSDLAETTKFKAPLITFFRRCKRKQNVEGDDKTVNKRRDTSSCEVAHKKGCFAGDTTDLTPPSESHHTSETVCQIENKIREVDSGRAHAISAHDAKILMVAGEEPIDGRNASKNVLHEDEKVLDRNDQIVVDGQKDTSCNNAMKVSSSNDKDVISGENSGKGWACEREESRAKVAVDGSCPVLDLSGTPTDSSGKLECNAYLESNSQKQSVHAVMETILGSMDSTSRSHAAISHQTFLPEMLDIGNERLWESTSHLGRDASTFVEEPSAKCKDSNEASPIPLDFMSKSKCLRLFTEERTDDSFQSGFLQPEVTTCMISEERKNFRFEIENNPLKGSTPFLGLSLPTKPKTTRFASNKCFATFPFLSSIGEIAQPFEDTLPQASSSRLSSFLRHKSMLDGIVSRARALSERDIFENKLQPYTSAWTEEELDSLWIGVRRYGRDNWNAMIRDPRLRFSPWRVASDLAEQWEEEQSKLFQHSKPQGIPLGVNNYSAITGIWKESMAEETRLSLGDVYARRGRNISRRARFKSANMQKSGAEYPRWPVNNPSRDSFLDYQRVSHEDEAFNCHRDKTLPKIYPPSVSCPTTFMAAKGRLPHWLREAVYSSPSSQREPPLVPSVAAIADHSQMMRATLPHFDHYELQAGPRNETRRGKDLQTSGGGGGVNHSSGTDRVDDVIVIDSDASSEETISDDRCARS